MYYELTDQFEVAGDIQQCWNFFGSAQNLPRITPPWLRFTIHPQTKGAIAQDSLLDYTIWWMGVPVRWRTKIIDWSPPRQFIDLQIRGPYALWHHQHRFEPVEGGGGVRCFDRVIYRLPMGMVGRAVHWTIVRKQLLDIFRHRRRVIGEHLGWKRALQADVEILQL